MLKRFATLLAAVALGALLAGCPSYSPPGSPPADARQQTIDATYASYKSLDVAAAGTLAMLKAGKLSTADARKALDAYKAARVALDGATNTLGAPVPPAAPPQ